MGASRRPVCKDVFRGQIAPPCRTFSQARKQAKVLRAAAHPEGFGNYQDLAEASVLAKITFAIAERAVHCGFLSAENPPASLIWRLLAAERTARWRGVRLLVLEQCACGRQRLEATGVLANADGLPGPRGKDAPQHARVAQHGRVWGRKDG